MNVRTNSNGHTTARTISINGPNENGRPSYVSMARMKNDDGAPIYRLVVQTPDVTYVVFGRSPKTCVFRLRLVLRNPDDMHPHRVKVSRVYGTVLFFATSRALERYNFPL